MANPRQRRKSRSSSHRAVKQSRRANKLLRKQAPIKGPKVIQDAWDNHKTVRQNYVALGLAHTLYPTGSSGQDMSRPVHDHSRGNTDTRLGIDKPEPAKERCEAGNEPLNASHDQKKKDGKPPRGFGRMIRDDSGAVVDVVLGEEEMSDGEDAGKDKELEYFEIENSSGDLERMVVPSVSGWLLKNQGKESAKEVVEALETKKLRTPSTGEIRYLRCLVERYGNDYEGMARDRKRNVNQYSAGRLKRAVERAKLRLLGSV